MCRYRISISFRSTGATDTIRSGRYYSEKVERLGSGIGEWIQRH